jgi:hypothetical protein
MTSHSDAISDLTRRAAVGDPYAQISLAWEYVLGERVDEDFLKAEALLRGAETKKPELARFYLAKAKILRRDASFVADLAHDCDAGYAPALYLMGAAADRGLLPGDKHQTMIHYFSLAAQHGHLVASFFVWRETRKSMIDWLVTFPAAARLFFRIVAVKFRDSYDPRVLT